MIQKHTLHLPPKNSDSSFFFSCSQKNKPNSPTPPKKKNDEYATLNNGLNISTTNKQINQSISPDQCATSLCDERRLGQSDSNQICQVSFQAAFLKKVFCQPLIKVIQTCLPISEHGPVSSK